MTLAEFNSIVRGETSSSYLTEHATGGTAELAEYKRMEEYKCKLRDAVREVCPIARKYHYETSWMHGDFSGVYQAAMEVFEGTRAAKLLIDLNEMARGYGRNFGLPLDGEEGLMKPMQARVVRYLLDSVNG